MSQGRDILKLNCRYQPQQENTQEEATTVLALNSHLESEKGSTAVRTSQLTQLASLMHEESRHGDGRVVLIAGPVYDDATFVY